MNEKSLDNIFQKPLGEQYGGLDTVGAPLWLEHVEGIKYEAEDGSEHMLTQEMLAQDHDNLQNKHFSPSSYLFKARHEEALFQNREAWLRAVVMQLLPLKIVGNKDEAPLLFNSEFKVHKVPRELIRNAGVIYASEQLAALRDQEIEDEDVEDEGSEPSQDLTEEPALTFSLRLVPEKGEISEFSYLPGGTGYDEGLGALTVTDEAFTMQLGHRIYAQIYRKKPEHELPPLIAPHQF
jgi:hypothetical protein